MMPTWTDCWCQCSQPPAQGTQWCHRLWKFRKTVYYMETHEAIKQRHVDLDEVTLLNSWVSALAVRSSYEPECKKTFGPIERIYWMGRRKFQTSPIKPFNQKTAWWKSMETAFGKAWWNCRNRRHRKGGCRRLALTDLDRRDVICSFPGVGKSDVVLKSMRWEISLPEKRAQSKPSSGSGWQSPWHQPSGGKFDGVWRARGLGGVEDSEWSWSCHRSPYGSHMDQWGARFPPPWSVPGSGPGFWSGLRALQGWSRGKPSGMNSKGSVISDPLPQPISGQSLLRTSLNRGLCWGRDKIRRHRDWRQDATGITCLPDGSHGDHPMPYRRDALQGLRDRCPTPWSRANRKMPWSLWEPSNSSTIDQHHSRRGILHHRHEAWSSSPSDWIRNSRSCGWNLPEENWIPKLTWSEAPTVRSEQWKCPQCWKISFPTWKLFQAQDMMPANDIVPTGWSSSLQTYQPEIESAEPEHISAGANVPSMRCSKVRGDKEMLRNLYAGFNVDFRYFLGLSLSPFRV